MFVLTLVPCGGGGIVEMANHFFGIEHRPFWQSPPRYGTLTRDGEEAVGGRVMMLKGANSAALTDRVKERVVQIQKSLPEGMVIEPYLVRDKLLSTAIGTVKTNLIEGGLIVIFILVLMLELAGRADCGFRHPTVHAVCRFDVKLPGEPMQCIREAVAFVFIRNFATLPPLPQPKHLKMLRVGETLKNGVFSWWKGQRAVRFAPLRFSGRKC